MRAHALPRAGNVADYGIYLRSNDGNFTGSKIVNNHASKITMGDGVENSKISSEVADYSLKVEDVHDSNFTRNKAQAIDVSGQLDVTASANTLDYDMYFHLGSSACPHCGPPARAH